MNLRRMCTLTAMMLAPLLSPTASLAQGIPVYDNLGYLQQVQQVLAWSQQLQAMTDQYRQQIEQYSSLTGYRGFGDLEADLSRQYLPQDWLNAYESIRQNGVAGLSPAAQSLRQQMGAVQYNCEDVADAMAYRRCQDQIAITWQNAATAGNILERIQDRSQSIQRLLQAIQQTQDPKGIAELQARLQAEQVSVQNDSQHVAMALEQERIQRELRKQSALDAFRAQVLRTGGE